MTCEGFNNYATSSVAITLANDRTLRDSAQSLDTGGPLIDLADALKDWIEGMSAIDDASAGVPEGEGLIRASLVRAGFSEVEWREIAEYVRIWDQ